MIPSRLSKPELGTALMLGLLLALAGGSAWSFREARRSAQSAAEALADCRRLAAQIEHMRRAPRRAAASMSNTAELASRVEEAARGAGIAPAAVLRIEPEPGRRVGDSAYRSQATRVELDGVSLRGLITFLDRLRSGSDRLEAERLRLSAPRGAVEAQDEPWRAEVVLTQLVFAPITRGR